MHLLRWEVGLLVGGVWHKAPMRELVCYLCFYMYIEPNVSLRENPEVQESLGLRLSPLPQAKEVFCWRDCEMFGSFIHPPSPPLFLPSNPSLVSQGIQQFCCIAQKICGETAAERIGQIHFSLCTCPRTSLDSLPEQITLHA